jgi:integrase
MEWIEFVCIVVLAIPNLRVRQDDGATAYTPAPELLLSFWSEKLNTDLSILFAEGDRFEILFWLAVTTGLRQGELVGIKWSDVDWPNRRLRIQRQLQRLHGGLAFSEPKSAAGRRVIALGVATIEKLRKHQRLQLVEIQVAGKFWKENDMIFPSSKGTPMDPSNLYHNFKRLLVEAGLPNIRFHDLRYTAVTLMLQQGIHPKVVQERLGHSDISMTLNTYSHVLPVMQDDAAEKLDDLLTPINVSDEIKNLVESKFWYVPPAENDSGRRRLENR